MTMAKDNLKYIEQFLDRLNKRGVSWHANGDVVSGTAWCQVDRARVTVAWDDGMQGQNPSLFMGRMFRTNTLRVSAESGETVFEANTNRYSYQVRKIAHTAFAREGKTLQRAAEELAGF